MFPNLQSQNFLVCILALKFEYFPMSWYGALFLKKINLVSKWPQLSSRLKMGVWVKVKPYLPVQKIARPIRVISPSNVSPSNWNNRCPFPQHHESVCTQFSCYLIVQAPLMTKHLPNPTETEKYTQHDILVNSHFLTV